jgi:hypothetical protein
MDFVRGRHAPLSSAGFLPVMPIHSSKVAGRVCAPLLLHTSSLSADVSAALANMTDDNRDTCDDTSNQPGRVR